MFHKPNPRNYLPPTKIIDINRTFYVKLLGVLLSEKFDEHISTVLSQCNQRLYLLRQLKNMGLSLHNMDVVFNALIISKVSYALPAWVGFLSANLLNIISALFRRAFKYGLVSQQFNIL